MTSLSEPEPETSPTAWLTLTVNREGSEQIENITNKPETLFLEFSEFMLFVRELLPITY